MTDDTKPKGEYLAQDHQYFTVDGTAYTFPRGAEMTAIHCGDAPRKTDLGTSYSLRFPMLVLVDFIDDKAGTAAKVSDLLNAFAFLFYDSAETVDHAKPEVGDWRWWFGNDDEVFTTECATREEAVSIATEEYDGGYICEARAYQNMPLAGFFDAERFIEDAEDKASDLTSPDHGHDVLFEVTPEQEADLERSVRAAIALWQKRHGLAFKPWMFERSRNHEYIPAPVEADDGEVAQ